MNTRLAHRLASFVLAAMLTLVMMVGVNTLAVGDAPAGLLAQVAKANPA